MQHFHAVEEVHQQVRRLPETHSKYFIKYEHELDVKVLKQELTRENYTEKFHHLLCWEEREHDNILQKRYDYNLLCQLYFHC